ncbi:MAG TPA: urate oxidase [Candidatus Limnocylindrales bacterium]|nr:urate oxidase [Candidatus Limnocylindrales bacterium]
MIELADNRYGKQAIRLVKLVRGDSGHAVRDLTIAVTLEGAFDRAYTEGDNSAVVATDTMKNTVYALARDRLTGSIEAFGLAVAQELLGAPSVERATVELREHHWTRLRPGEQAFRRDASMTRTAVASVGTGGPSVRGGVEDLVVMKTAKSAFSGFPREGFTTLRETEDRIMASRVTADWRFGRSDVDYEAAFTAIVGTLLDAFAEHESRSVQESIWVMGRAILDRHDLVDEVHLVLPNLHHWTVDLSPFGIENKGEIFVAPTEPYGLIEGTIRRAG